MKNFNIQYSMFNVQYLREIRGQSYNLIFWGVIALLASGVCAFGEDKARETFDAGV